MSTDWGAIARYVQSNPAYQQMTAGWNDQQIRDLIANLQKSGTPIPGTVTPPTLPPMGQAPRPPGAPPAPAGPQQPGPVETIASAVAAANVRQAQQELAQRREEYNRNLAEQQRQFDVTREADQRRLAADIAAREQDLTEKKRQFDTSLVWERDRFGQDNSFRYADLGLRERQLDMQRSAQSDDVTLRREQMALQERLAQQEMGLGRERIGLERELGQGRIGLERELGLGNLALGQGRLGLDTQRLGQEGALGAAQILGGLRGPRDWMRYHQAQQGLRQGGLPSAIEQVLGYLQQNGGVAPGVQYPPPPPPMSPEQLAEAKRFNALPLEQRFQEVGQTLAAQGRQLSPEQVQQFEAQRAAFQARQQQSPQQAAPGVGMSAAQQAAQVQQGSPGAGMSRMPGGFASGWPAPPPTAAQIQQGSPGTGMSRMPGGFASANPAGATAPPPLPRGTQVNPQAFLSMTPDEREMLLGAVEAAGGSANDFLAELQKTVPKAGAAPRAAIRY